MLWVKTATSLRHPPTIILMSNFIKIAWTREKIWPHWWNWLERLFRVLKSTVKPLCQDPTPYTTSTKPPPISYFQMARSLRDIQQEHGCKTLVPLRLTTWASDKEPISQLQEPALNKLHLSITIWEKETPRLNQPVTWVCGPPTMAFSLQPKESLTQKMVSTTTSKTWRQMWSISPTRPSPTPILPTTTWTTSRTSSSPTSMETMSWETECPWTEIKTPDSRVLVPFKISWLCTEKYVVKAQNHHQIKLNNILSEML